ncbi:hypothetical protein EI94DRAFT_1808033 [Lactarius quietus]|nr:hypothetical protein EI94DRAFT_1808033 [Lactarius quietus]
MPGKVSSFLQDSIQTAIDAREGLNADRMSCSPTGPTFGDPATVALPFNPVLAKVSVRPPPPLPPLPPLPPKKGGALPTGCGGPKPIPGDDELLVFDILNTFHRRWFLSWEHLVKHIISAQKAEDGTFSWVEFPPPFHSHLVKCAVVLVPHPVRTVKRVMFVFLLELLNREGHLAFFELQKGGRKANNAQKEKRRLAWKRSRAAKREQDHEATKVASLPARERICVKCGRKFALRKTAKKHKCSDSKVVHVKEAEGARVELRPVPIAKPSKPASSITPHTPTVKPSAMRARANPYQGMLQTVWLASQNTSMPPVTGDSGEPFNQPPVLEENVPRREDFTTVGAYSRAILAHLDGLDNGVTTPGLATAPNEATSAHRLWSPHPTGPVPSTEDVPTQRVDTVPPPLTAPTLLEHASVLMKRQRQRLNKKAKGLTESSVAPIPPPKPSVPGSISGTPASRNYFAALDDIPPASIMGWDKADTGYDGNSSHIPDIPVSTDATPPAAIVAPSPASTPPASQGTGKALRKHPDLQILSTINLHSEETVIARNPGIFGTETADDLATEWDESWGGLAHTTERSTADLRVRFASTNDLPLSDSQTHLELANEADAADGADHTAYIRAINEQWGGRGQDDMIAPMQYLFHNIPSTVFLAEYILPETAEELLGQMVTTKFAVNKMKLLQDYDIQMGGDGSGWTVMQQLHSIAKSEKEKEAMASLRSVLNGELECNSAKYLAVRWCKAEAERCCKVNHKLSMPGDWFWVHTLHRHAARAGTTLDSISDESIGLIVRAASSFCPILGGRPFADHTHTHVLKSLIKGAEDAIMAEGDDA